MSSAARADPPARRPRPAPPWHAARPVMRAASRAASEGWRDSPSASSAPPTNTSSVDASSSGASGFETSSPGTGPSAAKASSSEHRASASAANSESRETRFTRASGLAPAAQRVGEHEHHVAGGERRAALQHERPPPLPDAVGGIEQQLLREVGAARHDAHQRDAGEREGEHASWAARAPRRPGRRCGRGRAPRRRGRPP